VLRASSTRSTPLTALARRHALPLAEGGGDQAQGVEHVDRQAAWLVALAAGHVVRGDARLVGGIGLDGVEFGLAAVEAGASVTSPAA
jgi:hypothetical protein